MFTIDLRIFLHGDTWVSLFTLTLLEIVLGIDNIVFLAIVVDKLPEEKQRIARRLGLILALMIRIGLLFTLSWVLGLKKPLFTLFGHPFAGRDFILLGGGLFLIAKSTREMFDKVEQHGPDGSPPKKKTTSLLLALIQILLLDIIFSLDSVITAVGMAQHLMIMITAMVISMIVMLAAAGPVASFVNRHPSMRVLALSFLLLIGVLLIAEGMGQHIDKGYIYFAMGFSLLVELVKLRNARAAAKAKASSAS